ncbi:hypothetical protein Pelo_5637 [Pelomyxa schiedti]|nr:hypothetical protein Pelo_5637 [Pelomyxa schiedti]
MQADNTQFFTVLAPVPLTEPFSWDRLSEIVGAGKTELLGREPAAQTQYVESMRGLKGTWKSVDDFILVKHFGWTQRNAASTYPSPNCGAATAPTAVWEAHRPPEYDESTFVRLSDNDYPYWVEDGIRHHVLWSGRHLSEVEVDAELGRALGPGHDVMWFENKGDRKSIKRLHHVQVFSRRKLC